MIERSNIERDMTKNSRIPLFFGLNRQFIIYFLIFAYVPLFVISVFGYFLNRDILEASYEQKLVETNRMLNSRITDYFEHKQAIARSTVYAFLAAAGTENINFKEPLLRETVLHAGFDTLQFTDAEKTGTFPALRENDNYVFIPVSFQKVHFWAGVAVDSFRNLLQQKDSSTGHGILVSGQRLVTAFASDAPDQQVLNVALTDDASEALVVSSGLFPDWKLVSVRETTGLFGELKTFLFEIIIGNILMGILMLSIAILLARRINEPVRSLIAAVNEISRGELSKPIRIESKDEIKLLADEFEMMRQKLLESYSNLENKIDARTKQLKEAQFQISHQEKMASLGLMAAGIAHEIGNPLTSISSMAQIIRRKTDNIHIVGYINTIAKNIERISKIVRELVDFARPSSYESAYVQVNEVVKNAVGIVRYDRRAKNINIQLALERDLPELYLVEDQLYQVFFNILINAVDAIQGKKAEIDVRSYIRNEHIYIEFEDSGIGIDKRSQNKIFEPFFTTKGVGKGTGLGLSVSYGIIKNLSGEIRVESEIGKGSIFTVVLPVTNRESLNES